MTDYRKLLSELRKAKKAGLRPRIWERGILVSKGQDANGYGYGIDRWIGWGHHVISLFVYYNGDCIGGFDCGWRFKEDGSKEPLMWASRPTWTIRKQFLDLF